MESTIESVGVRAPDTRWRTYDLFGVRLRTDVAFANRMVESIEAPDLTFIRAAHPPLELRLDDLSPIYQSPYKAGKGESIAALYHVGDCEVLRFTQLADFYLWPERIICHLLSPAHEALIEIRLLGPVFSYWLERQRITALHASAVSVGDQAVAFLASGGGGKTSLAAAMMQVGHPLLTDDILPIEERHGTFFGRPGYPQMRMWPEEAEHFLGHYDHLETVHPDLSKRRVPVGSDDGMGSFRRIPQRLRCVYLPERRPPESTDPTVVVEPALSRDAVIELVRHSFSPYIVEAVGLQPARLAFFARLIEKVQVRRLVYPHGLDRLPLVVRELTGDVGGLGDAT